MSEKKITPLHDRVIVKPEEEQKEAGGIILPDSAKEKPNRGIVIAVGNGNPLGGSMTVKPNDVVLYGKFAGTETEVDGETYLIMRESDILAII